MHMKFCIKVKATYHFKPYFSGHRTQVASCEGTKRLGSIGKKFMFSHQIMNFQSVPNHKTRKFHGNLFSQKPLAAST